MEEPRKNRFLATLGMTIRFLIICHSDCQRGRPHSIMTAASTQIHFLFQKLLDSGQETTIVHRLYEKSFCTRIACALLVCKAIASSHNNDWNRTQFRKFFEI